jgi:hypothetical protein
LFLLFAFLLSAFEMMEDFIPISRQSEIPVGDGGGFIGTAFLRDL